MKNDHSFCRQSSRTRDQIVIPINRVLLCGSVSSLLITTAQFALYWLVLGAMVTNTDCRIEDDELFNLDEVFLLLDVYACSSIPPEPVMLGDFLTPQEA